MMLPDATSGPPTMDCPGAANGRFRKRPAEVTATRWWANGDHPDDGVAPDATDWMEGAVVRRYRHPDDPGGRNCAHCGQTMHEHGWIDTLEGGHIVCPGDWVVTGIAGEVYPVKPSIFDATYESVVE